MISNRWLEKRKPYWARLEELVQRSSRGVAALSHGELQELGLLYRQTASDLAAVREDATTRQLASYLNQLLGRCHNLIYLGHKPKVSGIVRFYRDTYPHVFRQTLPQTLLALGIFAATGIVALVVTWHDPAFAYRLLWPTDDGDDRTAQDVDGIHSDGEAAGFLGHHDQQSFRGLQRVRNGN